MASKNIPGLSNAKLSPLGRRAEDEVTPTFWQDEVFAILDDSPIEEFH